MSITAIMPSRDGLVAEYLFSGNTQDTSGYGNHATNSGATLTTDKYGRANEAYNFPNNDAVVVRSYFRFANQTSATICCGFVKLGTTSDTFGGILVSNTIIATGVGFGLYVGTDNKFALQIRDGATIYSVTTANAINNNVAYFGAMTFDWASKQTILYLDGVNIGEVTATGVNNNWSGLDLCIGRYSSETREFNGNIDTIKIYNRVLSPAAITKLYNYWLSH